MNKTISIVLATVVILVFSLSCNSRQEISSTPPATPNITPSETPSSTHSVPPTNDFLIKLSELPIRVGGMAFNEAYNNDFEGNTVDTWTSDNLYISLDGQLTGTFVTNYGGKPLKLLQVNGPSIYVEASRDVLFISIRQVYTDPRFGDSISYETNFIPVIAQQSSQRSATFNVTGTFEVPSSELSTKPPPTRLEVNLTWVRVYNVKGILYFQILPGDAEIYYPNIPETKFNKTLAQPITGRFGHYSRIFTDCCLYRCGLLGNGFNYCTWLKQNLEW